MVCGCSLSRGWDGILSPMRIDSAIPFHVAKAYGVKPLAPVAAVKNAPVASSLVGGRVDKPVDFTGSSPASTTPGVLQLYNRAADKVEAAIAVQIGRQLDVRG